VQLEFRFCSEEVNHLRPATEWVKMRNSTPSALERMLIPVRG